jgi:hypothetical protein
MSDERPDPGHRAWTAPPHDRAPDPEPGPLRDRKMATELPPEAPEPQTSEVESARLLANESRDRLRPRASTMKRSVGSPIASSRRIRVRTRTRSSSGPSGRFGAEGARRLLGTGPNGDQG